MKFKKSQKLEIDGEIFTVTSIRDINFTHDENNKTYYTYLLSSENENITNASINYISDDKVIFHLTKKVKSIIKEKEVLIKNETYKILIHNVGIFMDYGEHKDVHEYKLKSNLGELCELHILPDNAQILYLNKKITLDDVIPHQSNL